MTLPWTATMCARSWSNFPAKGDLFEGEGFAETVE